MRCFEIYFLYPDYLCEAECDVNVDITYSGSEICNFWQHDLDAGN